ncbi:MAG: LptA/OstA family protein [Chitinispirillia bacterium]|jgi:lipopolysaccharide export system protein LptA
MKIRCKPELICCLTILLNAVYIIAEEKSSTLVLKNADYNTNSLINGQWISYLKGNVVFEYDNGTISADQATWHRSEGKIFFLHNINITIDSTQISCQRIDYFRAEKKIIANVNIDFFDPKEQIRIIAQNAEYELETKQLSLTINPKIFHFDTANSDTTTISAKIMTYDDSLKIATAINSVEFINKKEQIHIFAQNAEYLFDRKYLTLTENPKMVQYDTAQSETLTIVSDTMIYNDSLKTATLLNDVFMTQGVWKSMCKNATYNTESGTAKLRNDPWIYYDIDELTGDSIDLFFNKRVLKAVSVMRNVRGFQRDISENDTIFREVTGDSIYMSIADSNSLDKIWVWGNAKTLYYSSGSPENINEAYGKVMELDFVWGEINTLDITDNAEFFYYLDDKKDTGRIESSGDKIKIKFKNGDATFMTITGAVRGTYFSKRAQ